MRFQRDSLIVVLLLSCASCAHLDYVKVPTPTQYDKWTDRDQRNADKMQGVRYYLPRPFLSLKQSTPVAQRVAFVSFAYNASTKSYDLIPPEQEPEWVKKVAPRQISITQALAASLAGEKPTSGGGGPQGTLAGGGKEGTAETPAGGGQQPGPDTAKAATTVPSELHAHTGFISDTDPITHLGDRFDVVYLPDFEEQFVIQPHTGLGKGEIETKLRNGWAAEVFSQSVDNSNVIPFVVDQISKASDAAAGIFTTWAPMAAGLPPGLKPPKLGQQSALAGGGPTTNPASARAFLGDVLLFKIAEVKIAQPGLYPILKPREVRQWLHAQPEMTDLDPEAAFDQFLQRGGTPWIRTDMAFIPCPPFTMIGFNCTTDVFLAPATDRIVVDDGGNGGGGKPKDGDDKDRAEADRIAIRDALNNRDVMADALGPATAAKFDVSGTNVSVVAIDSDATRISVLSKSKLDDTERDQARFNKWITRTLKIAESDIKEFNFKDAADHTTVNVRVGKPMDVIASGLK